MNQILREQIDETDDNELRRLCTWLKIPGALVMGRRLMILSLYWEGVIADETPRGCY